jgi:hypothetical protein
MAVYAAITTDVFSIRVVYLGERISNFVAQTRVSITPANAGTKV